jgi:hypothetical protein
MPGQFDLVAFGNPLLDMQIRDGEEVLKKVCVPRAVRGASATRMRG